MEQEIYDSINKVPEPEKQVLLKVLCVLLFLAVAALGWMNREQRADFRQEANKDERVQDTLRNMLERCRESKYLEARSDFLREQERALRMDSLERILKNK